MRARRAKAGYENTACCFSSAKDRCHVSVSVQFDLALSSPDPASLPAPPPVSASCLHTETDLKLSTCLSSVPSSALIVSLSADLSFVSFVSKKDVNSLTLLISPRQTSLSSVRRRQAHPSLLLLCLFLSPNTQTHRSSSLMFTGFKDVIHDAAHELNSFTELPHVYYYYYDDRGHLTARTDDKSLLSSSVPAFPELFT